MYLNNIWVKGIIALVLLIDSSASVVQIKKKECINDTETMNILRSQRLGAQRNGLPEAGIILGMLKRSERLVMSTQMMEVESMKSECSSERNASRHYCRDDGCGKKELPALLWSYPGSGNTFVRTLIEFATKIYSGSIYDDASIKKYMPGEGLDLSSVENCKKVSVIKAHPNIGGGNYMKCRFPRYSICGSGVVRAIFLVRHPLSAAWSEFQRQHLRGHVGAAKTISRTAPWWQQWLHRGPALVRNWVSLWRPGRSYTEWMAVYGHQSYHIVRYEDLIVEVIREVELQAILNFAGLSHLSTPASIQCAFSAQLSEAFHRHSSQAQSRQRRLERKSPFPFHIEDTMLKPVDPESSSAHKAWGTIDNTIHDQLWSEISSIAVLFGYTQNVTTYKLHLNSSLRVQQLDTRTTSAPQ